MSNASEESKVIVYFFSMVVRVSPLTLTTIANMSFNINVVGTPRVSRTITKFFQKNLQIYIKSDYTSQCVTFTLFMVIGLNQCSRSTVGTANLKTKPKHPNIKIQI